MNGERDAVDAAMRVLDAHMDALNRRDEAALEATLHFPHYRLSGPRMQVWETPGTYLADFRARAEADWARSAWDEREVVAADAGKVHLAVRFTRYRADGSALSSYRSLWVVTRVDARWGVSLRSTFAP